MNRLQVLLWVLGAVGLILWALILIANRYGWRPFPHNPPAVAKAAGRGGQKTVGRGRGKLAEPPPPPKITGPTGPADLQAEVTPFYQSIPFPLGVESRVRIRWSNLGKGTALEARADAGIYFRPRSEIGEKGVIRDWQNSFEMFLKYHKYADTEAVDLFPTDKGHPPLESIALGPSITADDLKAIISGKETIYVVSAIRFQDSLGEHESRSCEYVSLFLGSTLTAGSPYKMRFVRCKDYNASVEIHGSAKN